MTWAMQPAPGTPLAILAALLAVAPLSRASEPPPEAVLAELPFEAGESNRVIIDLAPEGSAKPFPLFLDTGADWSVLTPRMARDLGVKVRRLKNDPYRRETRLGRDLQFWIDDRSSDTASKTGWEYGLLGGQFLAEYVLEIDFPARRVRFLDRRRYEVPEQTDAPDEAVLPVKLVSNRPAVEIGVEGRPILVMLDTGAPPTATIQGRSATVGVTQPGSAVARPSGIWPNSPPRSTATARAAWAKRAASGSPCTSWIKSAARARAGRCARDTPARPTSRAPRSLAASRARSRAR